MSESTKDCGAWLFRIPMAIASGDITARTPSAAADLHRLFDAVRKIETGADVRAAFDLLRGPGRRSLATEMALRRRDALIAAVARIYFRALAISEQAQRIAEELDHYRRDAWLETRLLKNPPQAASPIYARFWEILKLRDVALSPRRIETVLRRARAH